MQVFDVSQAAMGSLTSAFAFSMIASAPIVGPFVDKCGKRVAMLFGLVLQIGAIGLLFFENYWIFFISRLLQGISSNLTWTAGIVLLDDLFPAEQQGKIVGAVMTAAGKKRITDPRLHNYR